MLLYRYFASHAFESLRDARLKVSCISSFNDPFESRWGCGGEMNRAKAKKIDRLAHESLVDLTRKFQPHLNRHEISRHLKAARNQRLEEFVRNYKSTEEGSMVERGRIIDKTFRVICFASSEAEPGHEILMWSHYSASHSGVRIGFEIPKSRTFSLSPINYSAKRVAVDMSVIAFNPSSQKEAIKQSVITKNKAWEYEREYRLFIDPSDCIKDKDSNGPMMEFIPIQRDWVKRVDFGIRYPQSERTSFLILLKNEYPHVECYQAQYHKTDYALDYERLS